MTSGDFYRTKAAELRAKALHEPNPVVQAELEGLATAYLRLAEQADRNKQLDVSYETPLSPESKPDTDAK
jgi:hypothetical protein